METSTVIDKVQERRGAPDLRVVLAFMAIYFLWGATFLAIRVAVLETPDSGDFAITHFYAPNAGKIAVQGPDGWLLRLIEFRPGRGSGGD